MIRIGVCTDDRLFSAGLLGILGGQQDFEAIEHPASAPRLAAPVACDVLLVDSRMEGALEMCAAVKRASGPPSILVAAPDDDAWAPGALGVGARGILAKSAGASDLVHAVRVVHDGLIWARRRVIVEWLDRLTAVGPPPPRDGSPLDARLSIRERVVFRHAASGLGNRELADRLNISQATVKAHLTRIFQKLGVRTRGELAAAYHGIAPPAETPRRPVRRSVPASLLPPSGTIRAPRPLRPSS